jgi:hypothetical protein
MNPYIRGLYNPDDQLEKYSNYTEADLFVKGKKKHSVGDIILIGGKKHIVILDEHGKVKYKYYGSGQGAKAKEHKAHKPAGEGANPDNIDQNGFEFVKALGGSTGAFLMKKNGSLFVKKSGNSPEHLANEARSLKYYAEMGVKVPKIEQYDKEGGNMYTEYIQGKTLKEYLTDTPVAAVMHLRNAISANFAVDCLMGNWDVIGQEYDNIIVTPEGVPYRVDVGGSLEFRAQGEKKTKLQWNGGSVNEFLDLRNININIQTASIFNSVTEKNIIDQLTALKKLSPSCLKGNTAGSTTLSERFNTALGMFKATVNLSEGKATNEKASKKDDEKESSGGSKFTKAKFYDFFQSARFTGAFHSPSQKKAATDLFDKLNQTLNISDDEADYIVKNWDGFPFKLDAEGEISIDSDKNVDCATDVRKYAEDNKMTSLEAACIKVYTGNAYAPMNKAISKIIPNSEFGNISFDSAEKMNEYKVLDSKAMKNLFLYSDENTESGNQTAYRYYLAAKLMARGLHKALSQGGNDVTDKNVCCYRNMGESEDASKLQSVYKGGSVVAQCRMSSKSYVKGAGPGASAVRLKYTAKALLVTRISKHGDSEKEVIFPPFMPIRVEFSEYRTTLNDGAKMHSPKLLISATDINDDFLSRDNDY